MGSNFVEEFGGRLYRQADWDHYPVCMNCRRYSVFMVCLDDIEKARVIYPDVHQGEAIFCSECVPHQEDYERVFPGERAYKEDSILNNKEILELLDYYCYNIPTFQKYAKLDRLILTSNVMLKADYKSLLKRPVPKKKKIKVLMRMFPPIHRFKNQKYANVQEWIEAVKAKCNEIRGHYRNLPEHEAALYHDQYDVLVAVTPRHARPSQNRALPQQPVNPVVEEEPADMTVDSVNVTMSSANNSFDAMRQGDDSDASDESIQMPSQNHLVHDMEGASQGSQPASSQEHDTLSPPRPNASGGDSDTSDNVQISSESLPMAHNSANISTQGSQPASSQEHVTLSRPRINLSGDNAPGEDSDDHIPQISSEEITDQSSLPGFSSQSTQPSQQQQPDLQRSLATDSQEQGRRSPPQLNSSGENAPEGDETMAQNISSQEVDETTNRSSLGNASDSSDSSDHSRRKRRSTDSAESEQDNRPGTSRTKRARAEPRMNPSPHNFHKNSPPLGPLPRLKAG